MNTWIVSTKVFLISAGVLSLAMGLKLTLPVAVDVIPAIWSVISAWLKPPYLYIVINGIIITIAATSRFHQQHTQSKPAPVHSEHSISFRASPQPEFTSFSAHQVMNSVIEEPIRVVEEIPPPIPEVVVYESEDMERIVEVRPVMVNGLEVEVETEEDLVEENEGGDVFDESPMRYNMAKQEMVPIMPELRQLESLFPVKEKPLVTSRFGHRKPSRSNPDAAGGRTLKVSRPKKHDTLENTWKMITEGRQLPLNRHVKKPDAFEHEQLVSPEEADHMPKSSEAFNNRAKYEAGLNKIRKEPSLGQDDLNRRVEAFIKKFNEDMRMQRQESLNQYMEMINRGV